MTLLRDTEIRLGQPQDHISDQPKPNRHRHQGRDVRGKARVIVEHVQDLSSRLHRTTTVRKPLCVRASKLKVRERLDHQGSCGVFARRDVVQPLEEPRHTDGHDA